jgi:hypothetical protein
MSHNCNKAVCHETIIKAVLHLKLYDAIKPLSSSTGKEMAEKINEEWDMIKLFLRICSRGVQWLLCS